MTSQSKLTEAQIKEFLHDHFVEDQVRDFLEMAGAPGQGTVVDMGGGGGFFAKVLSARSKVRARVIDMDPEGGSGGGQIVATGPPEEIAANPASHTGHWLAPVLHLTPPVAESELLTTP